MLNKYFFILIICALIICATFPSCTTTEVISRLPNTKSDKFGTNKWLTAYSSNKFSRSVGFQYLFGIIPFGKVNLKDPLEDITISVQGLGALPDPLNTEITLNAFDLFFTRSLSCKISTVLIWKNIPRLVQVNTSHQEWSAFGFSLDLSRAWTRCLWNLQKKAAQAIKR